MLDVDCVPAVRRMMKRGRDKGLYLRRPPELPRTLFPFLIAFHEAGYRVFHWQQDEY